jgi:hypothetical protein
MEFTLTVTAEEINIIGAALSKLPYEAVSTLIPKLQAQVNEQTKDIPNE